MISAKLLNDYRRALATVVSVARDSLSDIFEDLLRQGVTAEEMRDAMAVAAWGATSDLGNLASLAGQDFYLKIRDMELPAGADFGGWLAELPDFADVEGATRASARFMFDREGPRGRVYKADWEMFFRELVTNVERKILDAARDTVVESARHDDKSPRVAVVARPDACDFCQRAMREGWTVPRRAGTQTGIFHNNCHCVTAPSWSATPTIGGVRDLPVPDVRDRNPF